MIRKLLLFFTLLLGFYAHSQAECYLGVGGKDDVVIQKVFRLDSSQIKKMISWAEELKYKNKFLIEKADRLIKRHEESSPEVLMTMSYQYKKLLDSMQSNLRMIDKRMLGTFNEEQYNMYVELCNKLYSSPFYPTYPVDEK